MSKYTITLEEYIEGRYLFDNPSSSVSDLTDISDADKLKYAKELFPSTFPIYDNSKKDDFILDFVYRFWSREFSYSTVGRWKIRLRSWLYTKMPYYNELYASRLNNLADALEDTNITRTEEGDVHRGSNTQSTNDSTGTNSDTSTRTPNLTTNTSDTTTNKVFPINGSDYVGTDQQANVGETRETGNERNENYGNSHNSNQYAGATTSLEERDLEYKTIGYAGINKATRTKEYRDLLFSINDLIFEDMKNYLFMRIL